MAVADRETTAQAAINFLLASPEPAVRDLARRDVLGEDVSPDPDEILSGPLVRGLLRGQKRDGGFGGHPYRSGAARTALLPVEPGRRHQDLKAAGRLTF